MILFGCVWGSDSDNIIPQNPTNVFLTLEAIHLGDLAPGIELELISALDLQTITWNQVPVTWFVWRFGRFERNTYIRKDT